MPVGGGPIPSARFYYFIIEHNLMLLAKIGEISMGIVMREIYNMEKQEMGVDLACNKSVRFQSLCHVLCVRDGRLERN